MESSPCVLILTSAPRQLKTCSVPTRAILASFVSSEKTGVYRIHSEYDNFLTLPYACSFSHGPWC
jgi:hypothetical protein